MMKNSLFPNPTVLKQPLLTEAADVLVVPIFQKTPLLSPFKEMDRFLKGALKKAMEQNGFEGEDGKTLWCDFFDLSFKRILFVGLGEKKNFSRDAFRNAYAGACRAIQERKLLKVSLPLGQGKEIENHFDAALEGFLLRTYRFFPHLKGGDPEKTFQSISVLVGDVRQKRKMETVVERAVACTQATFIARDLVNEPANIVNPETMAKKAEVLAKDQKLTFKLLSEAELKKRGMNLILAVGMGSDVRPRMVHLEYRPKQKAKRKIALVGKGVTFDSGGLSLKPQSAMYGMKTDMAGAAAVLGAIWGIAKLKLPVHVHALVPIVENLPSAHSIRPGDVVKGYNGKSVEIENTDAEGRLILADALSYSKELKVDDVLNAATLTGACVVALGQEIAGIITNNPKLATRVRSAGDEVGEKLWVLPNEKNYLKSLKSEVADLKNVGGRWGGAITAGLFLEEFVDCSSWAHLDIAGPAYPEYELPISPKGGTGFGVRTFIELASSF